MKFILKQTKYTRTEEETEIDLPEESVFVYIWNGRDVIGIFPEPYDYTETSGNPQMKGLSYHCYWGHSEGCHYYNIPDWRLKQMASVGIKSETNGKLQTLFLIITEDRQYEGRLTKEQFYEKYEYYKAKLELPKDV